MATASSSRAPDLESPQAQETTPLLQTESSSRPATIVAVAPPHDENPEAGPSTPGPATPGTASNPALGVTPRLDRWIVIHLLSTLAIGTVGYVFMIISMVLCAQGGDLYAYWFSSWDDTRYLLLLVSFSPPTCLPLFNYRTDPESTKIGHSSSHFHHRQHPLVP